MEAGNAVARYDAFEKLKSQFVVNSEKDVCESALSQAVGSSGEVGKSGTATSSKNSEIASDFNTKLKDRTSRYRKDPFKSKAEYASKTLMVGQWRNTDFSKNLLKTQDSDVLETASVTSCDSSAYSSKSGSSFLSPCAGSYTELSDAGSTDTFMEYDIYSSQTKNTSKSWNVNSDSSEQSLDTLSPDQVKVNARLWNKLIEDWALDSTATPTLASKNRMNGDIRLSSPASSNETLVDGVRSTSMCTDSGCLPQNPPKKFAWGEKSADLSSKVRREEQPAEDSSGNDTNAVKSGGPTRVLDTRDNTTTEIAEDLKNGTHIEESEQNVENFAKQVEDIAIGSGTVIHIKTTDNQEGNTAATSSCNRPNIRSVSDRIKQLKRSQSESAIMTSPASSSTPSNATRRSKFGEAYKMYRDLQTLNESPSPSGRRRSIVSVKERAQLFGQK